MPYSQFLETLCIQTKHNATDLEIKEGKHWQVGRKRERETEKESERERERERVRSIVLGIAQ